MGDFDAVLKPLCSITLLNELKTDRRRCRGRCSWAQTLTNWTRAGFDNVWRLYGSFPLVTRISPIAVYFGLLSALARCVEVFTAPGPATSLRLINRP
jgi:hypothetical protein